MIYIAGISIAVFISALLLVKKNKSKSDYFLFLWMLLNAVHLTIFYLIHTDDIYNYPQLLGLQFPLPLLHGVFLYLYVSTVTNQFPKKRYIAYLHLIPTIITYIYLIPLFLLPNEQLIEIFENKGKGYEIFQTTLLIAVFLSGVIYVIWSSVLLKNHKKNIRNQFSDIEDINLKWLQLLIYGLGIVWLIVIISQNDTYIFAGVSVFVILVGFFGVQQKNIFNSNKSISITTNKDILLGNEFKTGKENSKEKYQNSGLTDELVDEYYKKLIILMEQEELYKNSDLSLNNLANELGIHPNYLSQIINENKNQSFYDYVNSFRVEEFKRLIAIPKNQQFTIMTIAYDCGFNSKSSFNRYFKENTGLTPSQFIKSISRD